MRTVITAALALLVGAPCAAAPAPKVTELWRFAQPGLDVEAVLPRPDGSVLVAGEFDRPLSLPGDRTLTPVGDDDIALLLIGPDGALRAAHGLGSARSEAVHGLADVDGTPLLAATTRGTLTIGPRTISAPPGESPYLPGVSGLVIALGPDGRPIGPRSPSPTPRRSRSPACRAGRCWSPTRGTRCATGRTARSSPITPAGRAPGAGPSTGST